MCQRSVQIIPGLLRSRNELEEILAIVEERRLKLMKCLIISWVVMGYGIVDVFGFVLTDGMNRFSSQLGSLLLESVNERRAFIEELECLPGNLVAYKTKEELKRLQKDDLIKVMELRKVVLQLRLQVYKEVDFYKTL
ncbi:hypothetical protein Tco_0109232 [Tanacetum coccineum]